MMINLTEEEADQVRGYSDPAHALLPSPLKDGTYVLPVAVLDDPFHAEHHEFLNSLPQIPDPDPGTPPEVPGDPWIGGDYLRT
jgi:hypothetical protein